MNTRRILGLALIIMIFPSLSIKAMEKRVRIQRDDLVGTWIGLTTDELQMIRLTLEPRGEGMIAFSFLDEKPCVLQLASWRFDSGQIEFNLDGYPANCPRDRQFHGVARGNALELTLSGSGWKRSASLRKEEKLAERWRGLKAAMSPQN